MTHARFLRIGFVTLALSLSGRFAAAQSAPMLETPIPPPPPLVDPGPEAALLRVRVVGADGETTSATAVVNGGAQEPNADPYRRFGLRRSANRHKGPIRFRPRDLYFYTDGRFEVRVPPGPVTLEVEKGYAYRPEHVRLHVDGRDTLDIEVRLREAVDLAARGWYVGDPHVHLTRTGANDDTLLTLTSARGLGYAFLLSYNRRGYDRGQSEDDTPQRTGLGDGSVAGRGPTFIASGHEYRVGPLGHLLLLLPDAYVPADGPTDDTIDGPALAAIADQARALDGFVGLAHGGYTRQEADGLLLSGKLDFLELLQFGGYRGLGLDGWYDVLNVGYRTPLVGASDYPYGRELGSEVTVVWSDEPPTPRSFLEHLTAGRSFATTGPILFLEVGGRQPGEVLTFPAETDTILSVHIDLQSPQYPVRFVDLIVDGRVVDRVFFADGTDHARFVRRLRVRESSWVAARAYGDPGTEAHTNPVYLTVGDRLPFDVDSARRIRARLDASIEAIGHDAAVTRLRSLRAALDQAIEGDPSGLPRPDPGRHPLNR